MASLYSLDLYSDNKYSALVVAILSSGFLLSSVTRDHTDDKKLPVKSRPEQNWMRELRNLSLEDSRVVSPEDSDYHSIVKVIHSLIHTIYTHG